MCEMCDLLILHYTVSTNFNRKHFGLLVFQKSVNIEFVFEGIKKNLHNLKNNRNCTYESILLQETNISKN